MTVKFEDMKYERPDLEKAAADVDALLVQFNEADSVETQSEIIEQFNAITNDIHTAMTLSSIRASVDTKDEYYDGERTFYDENSPTIQEMINKYYKAISNSKFRDELEEKYGKQLFKLAEFSMKSFDPKVSDLLKKENKLSTEYSKLLASAEIEFDGKTLNLSEFGPYMQHQDREMRRKASIASNGFYKEQMEKIDKIYGDLVQVRDEIAKELGYKDFVELGYLRMSRIDYDRKMVEKFRKQVEEYVVPLATKLREKQRERIGVETLYSYDEAFDFKTGNATPKGNAEEILKHGETMYKELSPETDEFYQFMRERNLFDVEAKKGKEGGGYCTFISNYKAPFIFSNFNGTLDDITVLTHEAGHAFQTYMSRETPVPEYIFPTYESCEIHSMSMEYFTYDWMNLFFEEGTDKFFYAHLADNIQFLPYGVAIDEFQHIVYENPQFTAAERREAWQELERKYLPHRNYDGIEPVIHGAFWHRQGHVFGAPFYYIDYTLAQVCALQFWKKSKEDFDGAWKDYLHLCSLGGSKAFTELVAEANLKSPFEEGSLKAVVEEAERYLDSIDDKAL